MNADVCAVQDSEGHHCPSKPTHQVVFQGKTFVLCDGCYRNLCAGTYGSIHGKIDLQPVPLNTKRP
jgi:hypothetical protein